MASIRARLTVAYTGALVASVAAFAVALWGARRANVYNQLASQVVNQVEIAEKLAREVAESGEQITAVTDTLVGPVVTPRLQRLLAALPNHLLVFDSTGRVLYASYESRRLQSVSIEEFDHLRRAADSLRTRENAAIVKLSTGEIMLATSGQAVRGTPIARIVAGMPTSGYAMGSQELLGTLLVVAPFVFLVSVGGAYVVAGRAFRPVDQIINEVEAISDGRSLHRRVAAGEGGDEMSRLVATLNAMLGRLETSFGGLRRFTADASHELKTPLTVLRANVERAMSQAHNPTEQFVALEEALQETTRMADLVESLLTLARADEGRFDLHREPIELEPLVREVFETAVILGEDAAIAVSMPELDECTVMGDRTRLRQLFLNLVTNAIKYTPRGGKVELSLSRRIDAVTFSVKDSGIGIGAGDLPYVFERFWRADRARSRRAVSPDGRWVDERGGFGLGLSISQWIAQAHGGSITVSSRLGRGSTFIVTLPLPAEDGAVRETPAVVAENERDELLTRA